MPESLPAMDAVIDRLIAAFAAVGLPPITPPGPDIETKLEQISSAIAPLRLPDELIRFWRRVDPVSIDREPHPGVCTVDFALQIWQERLGTLNAEPRVLFPFCYESHCYTYVELEDGEAPRGAVFNAIHRPAILTWPSLTAYLDQWATMLEVGEYEWEEADWFLFDPDNRWDDNAAVRLMASLPIEPYDFDREYAPDPAGWPAHWLAAEGVTEENSRPRGATSTVAELLQRATSTGVDATGTVQAEVSWPGASGAGRPVTVNDGTGSLRSFIPAVMNVFAAAYGSRYELDLVVHPKRAEPTDASAHGDVVRAARGGDMEAAGAAAMQLYRQLFEAPTDATIVGLRPLA